jgi:hypothetical protein
LQGFSPKKYKLCEETSRVSSQSQFPNLPNDNRVVGKKKKKRWGQQKPAYVKKCAKALFR